MQQQHECVWWCVQFKFSPGVHLLTKESLDPSTMTSSSLEVHRIVKLIGGDPEASFIHVANQDSQLLSKAQCASLVCFLDEAWKQHRHMCKWKNENDTQKNLEDLKIDIAMSQLQAIVGSRLCVEKCLEALSWSRSLCLPTSSTSSHALQNCSANLNIYLNLTNNVCM